MPVSRPAILASTVFLAAIGVLRGPGSAFLRRLATDCINNVYSTPANAATLPMVPPTTTDSIPAYIALCQEWIRLDADYPTSYESYRIVEDRDTCMEWSAPHLSLMEIFAALIVSNHVPQTKYRHNCDRTKKYQEAALGFDYTTIQQVLNTPGLRTNNDVISTEAIKQQCRRCLLTYDPQLEAARVKSKGYHHCLAWPEDTKGVLNLDPDAIAFVPYGFPGVVPFSSMIIAFRQRLYHSALEWLAVTDKPPEEANSGIVYWLDPTTIGLAYEDVLAEIPDLGSITSISILSGPLCATAILPTGQVCHEYGEGLKDFLLGRVPSLESNGFQGEHGITFKIVASTAAAVSRMILANLLICPPRSPSCLLPSAAKRVSWNKALVLEDPSWMKSLEFMTIAGHHGTTTVKVLEASKIPPTFTPDVPDRRLITSEQYSHVNAVTDDEGYPEGITRAIVPSDDLIDALTPQHILDDVSIALEKFAENPNLFTNRQEIIPTMAHIQLALNSGDKLEANQVLAWNFPIDGLGGDDFRHGELSTDADSGFVSTPRPSVEYWDQLTHQRHESLLRIQHEWATAMHGHISSNRAGSDPSTIFEIQCPEGPQPDGSTISYGGGTVLTKSPSTIIISNYEGVTIKDAVSGVTVATGIENVPVSTVYREKGKNGYKIKEAGDDEGQFAEGQRREQDMTTTPIVSNQAGKEDLNGNKSNVVQIGSEMLEADLPFKDEVQKVCSKYKKRLQRAVASQRQEMGANPM